MNNPDPRSSARGPVRDRASRLSAAILRISQSLERRRARGTGPNHLRDRRGPKPRPDRPRARSAARDGRPRAHRAGARQPAVERGPELAALLSDPHRGHPPERLRLNLRLGRGPGDRGRPASAPIPQAARTGRRHRTRSRHLPGACRGARRARPGGEWRCGPWRPLRLHDPGRGGRGNRGGAIGRPGPHSRTRREEDADPRGGRRPPDGYAM